MTKDKELPRPKKTPFGKNRHEGEGQEDLLMADRMAMAAAEGKLDEYIASELPEGEYAKKLAQMMMGMTGIMPQYGVSGESQKTFLSPETSEAASTIEDADSTLPGDVVQAAMAGNVETLKELLAREMKSRTPYEDEAVIEEKKQDEPQVSSSMMDKELLDSVIRMAYDNKVSVDWVIARALKLYLEDYKKTGRL